MDHLCIPLGMNKLVYGWPQYKLLQIHKILGMDQHTFDVCMLGYLNIQNWLYIQVDNLAVDPRIRVGKSMMVHHPYLDIVNLVHMVMVHKGL